MTQKDYELIADAIYDAPVPHHKRLDLAVHFADRLEPTNEKFKRDVFVSRCLHPDYDRSR